MLDRWKRAVVHIQGATDIASYADRLRAAAGAAAAREAGHDVPEDTLYINEADSRGARFTGTAVFLSYEGRRYLATARHVLHDERSAEEDVARRRGASDAYLQRVAWRAIFPVVFRVPTLDDVMAGGWRLEEPLFLSHLRAGPEGVARYTYSSPDLDLAVISLDQQDTAFADALEARGHIALPLEARVAAGPSAEGAELFTVGFPVSVSQLGPTDQPPHRRAWTADVYAQPVFSFGRVAMLHGELPYFWADLSIYPGNSGGPVVEREMLVGFVSGQARVPVDPADGPTADGAVGMVRIPFAQVIKAEHIQDLIEMQIEKDAWTGGGAARWL